MSVIKSRGVPLHPSVMTPRHYDPAVKAEVYDCYLNTEMDITDISIKTGVPRNVVAIWAKEGAWAERKIELEREYMRSAESKYRDFIIKHKLPTVERHLEICKKLEERINSMLSQKGKIDSMELKRLSEALSSSAAVAARAAGVADRVLEKNGDNALPAGKRPLIAIGIAPTLAGGAEVKIIEGEAHEIKVDGTKANCGVSEAPRIEDSDPTA